MIYYGQDVDYERPELRPTDTPYSKALRSAYNRGFEAALGHFTNAPQCPYKRKDFADIWLIGFETADNNLKELNNPPDYWADIPV